MKNTHKSLRRKVHDTQVYQSLGKIQRGIVNTRQNLSAINTSLKFVKEKGVKEWEQVSQNSISNAEIIREIHTKNLEVKF
ncbi:hypothetical protein [Flavobacterium sp. T12S277]|uniref:hypothetical protein n=1 Tax=Flavobacterium sp. T12S277 TaxID=3402752 RepID=UPI003AEC2339